MNTDARHQVPKIDGRYQDHGDGTVTDLTTGLIWKRCSEGQIWDGCTCVGKANEMTWGQARWARRTIWEIIRGVKRQPRIWLPFAGYNAWRLPSTEELRTLVLCGEQNPCINATAFPNTPSVWFWAASTDAGDALDDASHARVVAFAGGYLDGSYQRRNHAVRLVREGSETEEIPAIPNLKTYD